MSLVRHILLALLILLSGCAKIWGPQPDGGETEMSSTGIGAITGAVVGAGLGLAIGSTTGNAGEGLFIGTAAGTATGAAIGLAIQGQDEKLQQQEELVARQDEIITEQGRQIEQLRRSVGNEVYEIPSFNQPSLGRQSRLRGAKPWDGSAPIVKPQIDEPAIQKAGRGRLAKTNRVRVEDLDLTPPVQEPMRRQQLAALPDGPPKPTLPSATVHHKPSDFPKPIAPKPPVEVPPAKAIEKPLAPLPATPPEPKVQALPQANTLPPAKKVIDVAPDEPADTIDAPEPQEPEERAKTNDAPPTAIVEELPQHDSLTQELAEAVPHEGPCGEAAKEASRGSSSTSDADKLFYFRRAIRLCPDRSDYYVEVGKVYVNIGRTQDAQHEFNKALELDPDNEIAQEELSMIMLGTAY